jgi:hypothetical protein
MPGEGDPSYARWSAAILVSALARQPPERGLGAIVLTTAPFVGEGDWPSDEFELTSDLGARLPSAVRVHVFHGPG